MNLVLDDAEEVHIKNKTKKTLGKDSQSWNKPMLVCKVYFCTPQGNWPSEVGAGLEFGCPFFWAGKTWNLPKMIKNVFLHREFNSLIEVKILEVSQIKDALLRL